MKEYRYTSTTPQVIKFAEKNGTVVYIRHYGNHQTTTPPSFHLNKPLLESGRLVYVGEFENEILVVGVAEHVTHEKKPDVPPPPRPTPPPEPKVDPGALKAEETRRVEVPQSRPMKQQRPRTDN
jgi:hypothetical protein